jgi:hypothetical protein
LLLMSAATDIKTFTAREDTGPALMGRVYGNDASAITQASLTSIALYVYNKAEIGTPIASNVSVDKAVAVFDTLQTDARWTKDSTGYNFRYDCPAAYLPSPGRYIYEFVFTPTSGAMFMVVFEGEILDRKSG